MYLHRAGAKAFGVARQRENCVPGESSGEGKRGGPKTSGQGEEKPGWRSLGGWRGRRGQGVRDRKSVVGGHIGQKDPSREKVRGDRSWSSSVNFWRGGGDISLGILGVGQSRRKNERLLNDGGNLKGVVGERRGLTILNKNSGGRTASRKFKGVRISKHCLALGDRERGSRAQQYKNSLTGDYPQGQKSKAVGEKKSHLTQKKDAFTRKGF